MDLKRCVLYFLSYSLLILSVMANGTCTTPSCVKAASKMLEQMDQTIDPCNDFYNFACGTFVEKTVIPVGEDGVDTLSIISDKLQEQLRALISDDIDESEVKPLNLPKMLYQACMNITLIEEQGLQPLLDVHESLGGWPVVKENMWKENSWTLQSFLKKSNQRGFTDDLLFSISIGSDPKQKTKNVIVINEPIYAFNNTMQRNVSMDRAYLSYLVDIAVIFGANRSRTEKEMRDCLEFELALSDNSRRSSDVRKRTRTIKVIQKTYPYFQWLDYFKHIFQGTANITTNENITVANVDYFNVLGKLLNKTSKRTIANYLMWKITMSAIPFLTDELRNHSFQYNSNFNGISERSPRLEECFKVATKDLMIAISALYVRKHFKVESKVIVMDMFDNIKREFKIILENVTWLDELAKEYYFVTIDYMSSQIAYPAELMDDRILIEYYQDYNVDESKYFETILEHGFLNFKRKLNKLRIPNNKYDWTAHSHADVATAFYESIYKFRIYITAGFLQGQFFSADHPQYMNYGAIGFVIGHEITHGFDYQETSFLWHDDTKIAYLEKAKCIIEQYGNFTEPNVDLPLNGNKTQEENIADNAGIKIAYHAYMKLVEKIGHEARLPGLNYSSNQMFWISAAQTWCSVYRPEAMQMTITTGTHSPNQFRVLGPLSNIKEFSMDFNCPEGSPMNPKKKCQVW